MSKMCPYFVIRRKEGVRFGGVFLGVLQKKKRRRGGDPPLKMPTKTLVVVVVIQ